MENERECHLSGQVYQLPDGERKGLWTYFMSFDRGQKSEATFHSGKFFGCYDLAKMNMDSDLAFGAQHVDNLKKEITAEALSSLGPRGEA